jgi:hypothetical protein
MSGIQGRPSSCIGAAARELADAHGDARNPQESSVAELKTERYSIAGWAHIGAKMKA